MKRLMNVAYKVSEEGKRTWLISTTIAAQWASSALSLQSSCSRKVSGLSITNPNREGIGTGVVVDSIDNAHGWVAAVGWFVGRAIPRVVDKVHRAAPCTALIGHKGNAKKVKITNFKKNANSGLPSDSELSKRLYLRTEGVRVDGGVR